MDMDSMNKEMSQLFYDYKDIFEAAKVSEIQYFKWLDLWNKHGSDGVRTAHRFIIGESKKFNWSINSLKRYVLVAHEVWRYEKSGTWIRWFKYCKEDENVRNMRQLLMDIKSQWIKRPKAKRKGAE